MSDLFDNNFDTEPEFKCNNEYAKNYNLWRKKEEINRLKTKYGETFNEEHSDDSSSSSDDDDEAVEITDKLEKDFFKTLASLKKKDPRIYDDKVQFFDECTVATAKKKKPKDKPMYIMDYERKLLLEKGAELSDSDQEENPRARSPTYVEEQQKLKESLKSALTNDDDEDNKDGWGSMFKTRDKSKEEKEKEEADYKQWLLGQRQTLEDESVEKDLKPLKDYWTNPKLDAGEKFLRDYILNKKFLDNEDASYVPTYDEVVHDSDENLSEDEQAVEAQEEFEHKFNYRFEEPDQEFIKRYPRTVESSLRKTDDRRKVKRQEVKERKHHEKEQKMDELKQLREMKRQEIEEKLKKLREITGNTEVAFENEDLDDDFDPDAHDQRMHVLFNDQFYQGDEGDQKPEFPDLDEELEIERWDKYNPDNNSTQDKEEENVEDDLHCEDDNFNMNCEYDPQATQKELIENSKGKKKRKRKSKFAEALSEPKPAFDPNDKTYEQYLDEYYKLDCEDIIGDLPCRFKYRKVIPNSFGLTIDEILKANDRELNRWCSLKKAIQHRPDHVEKYDQIAFSKKGQNEALKRKILPSLYADENATKNDPSTSTSLPEKKKRRNKKNNAANVVEPEQNNTEHLDDSIKTDADASPAKKQKIDDSNEIKTELNDTSNPPDNTENLNSNKRETNSGKKMKHKSGTNEIVPGKKVNKSNYPEGKQVKKADKKHNKNKLNKKRKFSDVNKGDNPTELSDARLQAFGIKPKRFRNKLKYGKK